MKNKLHYFLALLLMTPLTGFADSSMLELDDYDIYHETSGAADTSSASGYVSGSGLFYYGGAHIDITSPAPSPEGVSPRTPAGGPYRGNGPSEYVAASRTLVMGVQDMGLDITLQRKVYVPEGSPFVRWVNTIVNTGSADREVVLGIYGGLVGSPVILGSSNDDTTADVSDDWLTTGPVPSSSPEARPVAPNTIVHVFKGSGESDDLDSITASSVAVSWDYALTIPAGQTVVVMHFAANVDALDEPTALAYAEALSDGNVPFALNFMTDAEFSQLASEFPATYSASNGGVCFIATAAYGTPMAQEIDTLRAVRDTYLLDTVLGTAFVDTYYRLSPPIADKVAAHPALASAVRMLLSPFILLGKVIMLAPMVLLSTLLVMASLFVARRRTKGQTS